MSNRFSYVTDCFVISYVKKCQFGFELGMEDRIDESKCKLYLSFYLTINEMQYRLAENIYYTHKKGSAQNSSF